MCRRAAEQLPDDRIAFLLAARGQAVEPEDQFFAALQCLPNLRLAGVEPHAGFHLFKVVHNFIFRSCLFLCPVGRISRVCRAAWLTLLREGEGRLANEATGGGQQRAEAKIRPGDSCYVALYNPLIPS